MVNLNQLQKFERDGFLLIENFLSEDECDWLKTACHKMVADMSPDEHHVFVTGEKQRGDDYFLTSGDKIRYFYEEGAITEKGDLLVDKHQALNKIGHALHWLNPDFKRITFSPKVKELAKDFGFKDPLIVQSMYIFKQPGIGGEVTPHQDASFLYTEPVNVIGLWIPLEDATQENGCLSFVPGSHKGILQRRMIRNKNPEGPLLITVGTQEIYDDEKFVPLEVKKGNLVVIHGQVMHRSFKNSSSKSRHVYTFHIIEGLNTTWSEDNWLQPTDALPFPSLYTNIA